MKKIGIEVQRLFRKKKHGMEVVALETLRELQKMDKENEYVVFARDDEDRSCLRETENFKIVTPRGKTYFDWEQFSLPKAAKNNNVQILHSTCNTSALKLSIPLMVTLHDIIYLEKTNFKGTAYQNFGNIYRKMIIPSVIKKSRYVITVSNFERNVILERLKLPEEKVKVVYNAVHEKFNTFYDAQCLSTFRNKWNLPDHYILFLGNTAPKKNTERVINAYIEYSSSVCNPIPIVVTDYDSNILKQMLSSKNNNHLLKNFILPGFINGDEMPLLYNLSTIFLYPSLRESFGLPILEAMACGIPVITSTTSSMPEIAGDAAILADPYKTQNITDNIIKLLSEKKLQISLKEKGLLRASQFSWENTAREVLHLYKMM